MASFTPTVKLNGVAVSSQTIAQITIGYGRQSVYDKPAPGTVTLSLLRDSTLGTIDLDDVRIGGKLEVLCTPEYVIDPNPTRTRFYGLITDVTADRDTVNIVGVTAGLYVLEQLRAVVPPDVPYVGSVIDDPLNLICYWYEYLGQLLIDPTFTVNPALGIPFVNGAEASLSGLWYLPDISNDGYVPGQANAQLAYAANDEVNLSDIAQILAAGAMGCFYENSLNAGLNGFADVVYAPYTARDVSLATPDLTLTGDEVAYDWTADLDLGSYVTNVSVSYHGQTANLVDGAIDYPDRGSVIDNAPYELLLGTNPRNIATAIAYPDTPGTTPSAAEIADRTLSWGQQPGYAVTIDVLLAAMSTGNRMRETCDKALVGRLWEIPLLGTGVPTVMFLEGYTETITRTDWTMTVLLSDVRNSWYGQAWQDVTATLEWGQVPATTTWLDLQGEEL